MPKINNFVIHQEPGWCSGTWWEDKPGRDPNVSESRTYPERIPEVYGEGEWSIILRN